MQHEAKTRQQLVHELAVLHQRITQLEAFEAERKRADQTIEKQKCK